jgi:hypothetical protein
MTAVDVVKMIEVELVLLQVTERSATLVVPAWTTGVDGAKKWGG